MEKKMDKFVEKNYKIKRALLSVTNKNDLIKMAAALSSFDVEMISSGGTGRFLKENGFAYTPVEKLTGNPEAFGGRMKTLSFQIASGLLFRRFHQKDLEEADLLNIRPIDLVICNLYPFQKIAAQNGPLEDLIENIDIGGPTMIRSAAKNFEAVSILTSPRQYDEFLENYVNGEVPYLYRKKLSFFAFKLMADYEMAIAQTLEKEFFTKKENESLCSNKLIYQNNIDSEKGFSLRYGENPHQRALLIVTENKKESLASCRPIQGKELSYNNYLDADAAIRCNFDVLRTCQNQRNNKSVVIVKHSNPCGVAISSSLFESLKLAWASDPISSFGSILSFSHTVTKAEAHWLSDKFIEVIMAPDFTEEAMEYFGKKKNLRVLKIDLEKLSLNEKMMKTINGGLLLQEEDFLLDKELHLVTKKKFLEQKENLIPFGIMVTKHFKSNAIALFQNEGDRSYLIGAGMGNPNRLVSIKQAIDKAKENGHLDLSDSLLVSDAFFPFRDNIEILNQEKIQYIVQPGGSIKDRDVIDCCDQLNVSMAFTGKRHFRH